MKRITFGLFLLFLLLAGFRASAQAPRLYFDRIGVYEGLPESEVAALFQDKLGYIWIGTQSGLVRHDGYQNKVYRFGLNDKRNYPNCNIVTMGEDKNGDIWITTLVNGLFKYQRKKDSVIQYRMPVDAPKFNTQQLRLFDNQGKLWFSNATINNTQTVTRFDTVSKKFDTFGINIKGAHHVDAKNTITAWLVNGKVWLGTDNGLYVYDDKTDKLIAYLTQKDTSKRATMFPIANFAAAPGYIYGTTRINGYLKLFRFKPGAPTYNIYIHNDKDATSIGGDTVLTLNPTRQGEMWVGTNEGLSLYHPQTNNFTNYKLDDKYKVAGKNGITRINKTKDGKLWLITYAGLMLFDPAVGRFYHYPTLPNDPGSPTSNKLNRLWVDSTNTLWLGYFFNGAGHLNKVTSAFKTYTQTTDKESANIGEVIGLGLQKDGSCLLAAGSSLIKYNPADGSLKKIPKATGGNKWAVCEDDRGHVYYCSDAGLNIYDPVTTALKKISYAQLDSVEKSKNHIAVLFKDNQGMIWIGTEKNGVCRYNPATGQIKRYPFIINDGSTIAKNTLDDWRVLRIYQDRAGIIWVGTNYGGINWLDTKTDQFRSFFAGDNKLINCVTSFYETRTGQFWVGTYNNGLFMFDRKAGKIVKSYTEKDGLLFNNVMGIDEDKTGNLWCTTERDVIVIDTKGLIKNYPLRNGGSDGTMVKLANGNFVMALANGIEVFDPANLAADLNAPLVHIETITYSDPHATINTATTLQAFGNQGINLPWNDNRVTFNYIALHYTNPAKNSYAYMLEGYDKNWIQAGTSRSVTYTNLPPRKYVFRVKAANSDGVWNNTGDSITLVINAPWWFSWWAWLIYVTIFVFAVYSFIKYRSAKLIRENRLLEEKIDLRTLQLSEANKSLSDQQEEVITQRDRLSESINELKAAQTQLIQSEKMASLGELTAGIAHEIQNPLNFVNNFSELSVELLDELKEEVAAGNKEDVLAIADDLTTNLQKINHHGKRADFIVKGMLQHSRTSSGERQLTNINTLADEFLKLSYHGLRAKNKNFNAELATNFDENLPKVNVAQQDIGRVLLNLFNNAFYAVNEKFKTSGEDYKPTVTLTTSTENNQLIITVKDNGTGIPDAIKDKIMQPFFTTKPTGEGTGLGLSLSYDIIVKGHGGKIDITSKEGEGSECTIQIPTS